MLISRVGPSVALNDALRDTHEALAETVRKEIAARKEKGIPLDDETDFAELEKRALKVAHYAGNLMGAEAREEASALLAMCSGGLQELPPYEINPEYEGVRVTLRSMTERAMIETREAIAACKTLAEQHEVLMDYVARAVVRIDGVESDVGALEAVDGKLTAETLEVLDLAGMTKDLWAVCRHYAELPPSKKKRFGSPQPSNSETSTAAPAADKSANGSDATGAPLLGSTSSQTMTPTPAPGATS